MKINHEGADMKKAIVLLVFTLILLSTLFANGANEQKSTSVTKEEVVTLKLSHNMDFVSIPQAIIDAADRVSERYKAEGRNIRIEFDTDYQTIDWIEYKNNIVFASKIDDAPDMFPIADPNSLIKAGVLLDVTDVIDANSDKFANNAFSSVTSGGKIYAYPSDLPVRVIYYNKNDLKKIGYSDEEIAALPEKIKLGEFTFEDFIALCNEVVEKGGAKYGIAHRPGSGDDFLDVLNVLGGQYFDGNTLVFDSEGLLRFFQFTYDNANVTKITPQNLNQMGWTTINKMVGSGESFAYYGPIYSCGYVSSSVGLSNEEFAKQEEFVMFPKSQYTDAPFVTAAPQYEGISSKTKYPEICKDILDELTNGSSDYMARHAATINSLSSIVAANDDAQVKANPIIANITYMPAFARTVPSIEGLNTYTSELFKQIVALELGQTTPEAALADMKAQIELNLKDVIYK
jgi:Maltose-binding periplasmic proteins/domains